MQHQESTMTVYTSLTALAAAALILSFQTSSQADSISSGSAAANYPEGRVVHVDSPVSVVQSSTPTEKKRIDSEGGPHWDQYTASQGGASKQHIDSEGGARWDQFTAQVRSNK